MVKLVARITQAKLRVLLVHIPDSRFFSDLTAAKLTARWDAVKADQDGLITEVENSTTLLCPAVHLTYDELVARQKRIAQVRAREYDLIRFSGTGHINPYLRELVYTANESRIPIEASLAPESLLQRYIRGFPVSDVVLDY